jgi:leucyl/phenylalanyl-tRNA--protein transferase
MSAGEIASILQGYSRGYFLMADPEGNEVSWYSTHERTLIPLDDRFHCPRSLKPILKRGTFSTRINHAFLQAVEGCANRSETWINAELKQIYTELHQAGWAHSFETWHHDQLAGGILGLAIGGIFIGESMFYTIPNGSKVAMVRLVEHLRQQGFSLFDAQLMNPHLARFGAITVSQSLYLQKLEQAIQQPCRFAIRGSAV